MFHIRPLASGDLTSIINVFTASVHRLTADHYDATQRSMWAPLTPDIDAWTARLANRVTLVAERAGEIVGFIAYESDGHIDMLFVAPTAARLGVASLLYDRAELELTRAGTSTLYTEASLVAQPFFTRKGFSVVEEERVERGGVVFRRFAMRKEVGERTEGIRRE